MFHNYIFHLWVHLSLCLLDTHMKMLMLRSVALLKYNDAETLPKLKEMLPNVKDVTTIYDIRSWITPFINDIRKHTVPLHL